MTTQKIYHPKMMDVNVVNECSNLTSTNWREYILVVVDKGDGGPREMRPVGVTGGFLFHNGGRV